MILAHGPLGFLSVLASKKIWIRWVNKSQVRTVLLIGFLAGLLPDIDTAYFYLVSATESHRELITHSILIYILIFGIVFVFGLIFKSGLTKAISFAGFVGVLSHLIGDAFGSGVAWFIPFSNRLYGLGALINGSGYNWFNANFLQINLSLEILIIIVFVLTVIWNKLKTKRNRAVVIIILSLFWLCFVGFMIYVSSHLQTTGGKNYAKDHDNDGIVDQKDTDRDGDGILNIEDNDANGNGVSNEVEFKESIKRLEGVWYDSSEGGYAEMPRRFGMITNIEVLNGPMEFVGIHLVREMRNDYLDNPDGYVGKPEDAEFKYEPTNYYNILKHQNKILPEGEPNIFGDVLFFGEKKDHLAIVWEVDDMGNVLSVFEADESHETGVMSLDEVAEREGEVSAVGRVF